MKAEARSKGKPPAPDVCRLTLTIRGEAYTIRPIPPGWHHRAWQLRKGASGQVYHVTRGERGAECDCADATFRDHECKHIKAARACGLID